MQLVLKEVCLVHLTEHTSFFLMTNPALSLCNSPVFVALGCVMLALWTANKDVHGVCSLPVLDSFRVVDLG